jgi:hypothetical protein
MDPEPPVKSGCGSSVTLSGGILTAALAGAYRLLRKKKDGE